MGSIFQGPTVCWRPKERKGNKGRLPHSVTSLPATPPVCLHPDAVTLALSETSMLRGQEEKGAHSHGVLPRSLTPSSLYRDYSLTPEICLEHKFRFLLCPLRLCVTQNFDLSVSTVDQWPLP